MNESRITRSPLVLASEDWSRRIVIKLNQHNINCDSNNEEYRIKSQKILKSELSLTDHLLSNSGYCLIKLELRNNVNFAKIISDNLKGNILIEIPLVDPQYNSLRHRTDLTEEEKENRLRDPWKHWVQFKATCDNPRVKVSRTETQ